MELLIPGLILVAVMVWASTRIKRNAAAAFDAESIETDAFTLQKPSGWLSIAHPREHLFEAYTKEYSPPPNEEFRLGTARVDLQKGDLDDAVVSVTNDARVIQDERQVVGDVHYRILEVEREIDGIANTESLKFAERAGDIYTLRVNTLSETTERLASDIEVFIDSFRLK